MAWQCPTPSCAGAELRSENALQVNGTVSGVKRRVYRCQICKRNVSTEERVVDVDRRSTYLPRPGQYRSGKT